MNTLFDFCVQVLKDLENLTGISYEALNIWIFVIIHPLLTVYLFYLYKRYKKRYLHYKKV